jgi:hypothetical protein
MTTETKTRYLASAVTVLGYGDPEIVVQPQSVDYEDGEQVYWSTGDEVLDRKPLAVDPDTEQVIVEFDEFDKVLESMGWYRVRSREWETTDFGGCVVVERME